MNKKIELKGQCLCGEVKYKLSEKPLFTQACHCKDCKVLTGSSYVINSSILENTLTITDGELSATKKLIAGSGKFITIFFCKNCGAYIYTDYESAIGRLNVRTQTLENSKTFPPQAHIFTKDKDEWVNLSNINNCFEKMYDPKETWPNESLIRIKEYLNTKKMKNIYHSDIYKFNTPVKSYWEDNSQENLNLEKLTKDVKSEIVVIGGGYTGLLCAINLIENHNLDVILVEAGKIGWGASSRNAGFNCLPPSKMSFKKMQSIYGNDETKKFYKNSVEGSNYTKDIIKEYNIDCDVTGNSNYVVAHHPNKFEQIKEQARAYKDEFEIETEVYSKEEFNQIGHGGTEQYGAFSYKPGFAINPLKFVNGITKHALSKKLKIFEHTKVDQINKDNGSYLLKTKEGSIRSKKIVVATNGFYQEGLIPKMDGRVLPVISNIIVTRKLNDDELNLHNFKTFSPIANTKNLLYYYRKLPDNRILFGTRGDLSGSDQSNLDMSKKMEKFLKDIFPKWSNINIEYNWRGLIALSQKLTPSIGKIDNEEIYYGFGYNGVGVSAAPWTGKQLSKLVFSSNSKDLDISKIYKGLPKKFIFPKLRVFYFRLAVLFYNIKDKFNI